MKKLTWLMLILIAGACNNSSTPGEEAVGNEGDTTTESATPEAAPAKIIFFGNSLTAAYGLDPAQGFVALVQERLDSLGFRYKAVNAGLSGETTSGGNERVDWVLDQGVDIFVLELGGNDGLRGIDPKVSYQNLVSIIEKVKKAAPEAKIILAGMEAPPNMGKTYTDEFRSIYPRLAKEFDVRLIPFLLEGVGGNPELNQPDGIHPNVKGQKIVLENVWKVLKGEL
ncbi:MAG TPA: arylesterase [Flavilitoribacter sp.]|nr:arylesterase [Flavilitoribacter sp.]